MPNTNSVTPFIFDNIPVRGRVVRLANLKSQIPNLPLTQPNIADVMAQVVLTSCLFTSEMKNPQVDADPNVTVQLQSTGPISVLLARCSAAGDLRAYAKIQPQTQGQLGWSDIVTDQSLCAVTVDYDVTHQEPYQSMIGLNPVSLTQSLKDYFHQSVQAQTWLQFAVADHDNYDAGLIFLQALPDAKAELSADDAQRLQMLLDTLESDELAAGKISAEELLIRLFNEDNVRVFDAEPLQFNVPDTRERMATALRSLGREQVQDLLTNGPIEMACEFTGKIETFTATDVANIFADNA